MLKLPNVEVSASTIVLPPIRVTPYLTVVDRDPEQNLLLVKGAVPGHKNSLVIVQEDKKR